MQRGWRGEYGAVWGCSRSSEFMLWLIAWYFCGTPESGNGCVSDTFAFSWDSYPSICLHCPASIWGLSLCHIVPWSILFSCLLEVCSFLKGNRERVDLRERENGGNWEEWRKGNCGRNILYERRICFLFLKKKNEILSN